SYQVRNQVGETVVSGILNIATPIVFPATAGSTYTLSIPSRKSVNYQLQIENAALAAGNLQNGTLTIFGKPAAVAVLSLLQNAPIGVFEEDAVVTIKKPYSGAAAQAVMGDAYTETRVLNA